MVPLEQQYQLFASSGAIKFPIQPVTEAWKEKVCLLKRFPLRCILSFIILALQFEPTPHLVFFFLHLSTSLIAKYVSACRLSVLIFCLPQKNQQWMYHPTWKPGGGFLSFQIRCSWICPLHQKFAICFPSRKCSVWFHYVMVGGELCYLSFISILNKQSLMKIKCT